MVALGMPSFTVEDFYDQFLDVMSRVADADADAALAAEIFNDEGVSNYAVCFLRLLSSMHLQENAEFFQNFIADGRGVKDYCA